MASDGAAGAAAAGAGAGGDDDVVGRVLSIQSHVVFGYVGNKSAVFPLQLLGFDVCPLNSVQFSNHTGYGSFKGQVLDGAQVTTLVDGLAENGLLDMSHILTGYIGSASFLRAVTAVVKRVRATSPTCAYVCDPVLGDEGKLYVPAELVDIYRSEVIPLASLLTPNQFECELLSGRRITNVATAMAAVDVLHDAGAGCVVVTSTSLPAGQEEVMTVLCSAPWDMVTDNMALWGGADFKPATRFAQFKLTIPKFAFHFTGTGDLTAALLLAWSRKLPHAFVTACENAIASVQAVCARTRAGLTSDASRKAHELKIVACKAVLERPEVTLRAEPL